MHNVHNCTRQSTISTVFIPTSFHYLRISTPPPTHYTPVSYSENATSYFYLSFYQSQYNCAYPWYFGVPPPLLTSCINILVTEFCVLGLTRLKWGVGWEKAFSGYSGQESIFSFISGCCLNSLPCTCQTKVSFPCLLPARDCPHFYSLPPLLSLWPSSSKSVTTPPHPRHDPVSLSFLSGIRLTKICI